MLFCQQKKKQNLDDVVSAAKTPNGRSVYITPMGTAGIKKDEAAHIAETWAIAYRIKIIVKKEKIVAENEY